MKNTLLHHIMVGSALIAGLVFTTIFGALPSRAAQAIIDEDHVKGKNLPIEIEEDLMDGYSQDLLIVFNDDAVLWMEGELKSVPGNTETRKSILDFKADMYYDIKEDVFLDLDPDDYEVMRNYGNLPLALLRIKSYEAYEKLMGNPDVRDLYEDGENKHHLVETLPFIRQPQVESLGHDGTGTTVAVIDTGVDYTRPTFGSCGEPGEDGCKVVFSGDFTEEDDGSPDDNGHGTNVAGIVAGVAGGAKLAGLDVFDGNGAMDSNILSALDWVIQNREEYNIVAVNMSLGRPNFYTSCLGSPIGVAFENLRAAGVIPVVASGNSGLKSSIGFPACVPGAVSVGAVYDANIGPQLFFGAGCIDTTTDSDRVTCFSNSSSALTILAPGAAVSAAGITQTGTSQATPHVAGAVAVLKGYSAFPNESVDETVNRMTRTGVSVRDSRNFLIHPRLDIKAALDAN